MAKQNEELEYRDITPEEKEQVSKLFNDSFIRVGPSGCCMVRSYKELAPEIYNMELRKGDIMIATVQRSGTTWTQELVWLVANDLDYKKAASTPLTHRFPFLEFSVYWDDASIKTFIENARDPVGAKKTMEKMSIPATKVLHEMPSPRFIKTHVPMSLLPPKILDTAKVVYVARDPRDVVVSYYFLCRFIKVMKINETTTIKDLWNAMKKDLFHYMPYFAHVKEAWALRHHPNMLFLFYEELIKDLPSSIRRVADFLGKEVTPEQMGPLCDHLSFKNFKNNESVNYDDLKEFGCLAPDEKFIRKGKSGGWRDYFDEEMTREAERWIADNLRDTDLRFPSVDK